MCVKNNIKNNKIDWKCITSILANHTAVIFPASLFTGQTSTHARLPSKQTRLTIFTYKENLIKNKTQTAVINILKLFILIMTSIYEREFNFLHKKNTLNSMENRKFSTIPLSVNFSKRIAQFRYIKIQPKTIDLSTRLVGITTEFVGFIPTSLVLGSIVLG